MAGERLSEACGLSFRRLENAANGEYAPERGKDSETRNKSKHARRTLFGCADLADVYRNAKGLIIEHKLLRFAQFAEQEGIRKLTICNLWRIERLPDATIRTFEFALHTGEWEEVTTLEGWPEVPFYPIEKTRSLNWWYTVVRKAIWKALVAAGYNKLPEYNAESMGMTPQNMANRLIEGYCGRRGKYNKRQGAYDQVPGRLDRGAMEKGARALRGIFCKHFLDGEVLSAMLVIGYQDASFRRYLRYARQRRGLLKVAAEHRNLLPLLRGISAKQWERDDLFSRNLWVRDGRRNTALDRRPVQLSKGGAEGAEPGYRGRYRSFESAAAWRWLSKASAVIVREWDGDNSTIIVNLALANISVKAPVYAYVWILREAHRLVGYGVSPRIQRLLRIYLAHCAKLWKESGYRRVRKWIRDGGQSRLSVMLDYLDAEGFERGFPDKQSTWAGLLRRSDDWHSRIAIERMEQELDGLAMLEWSSLVPSRTIGEIVLKPINNSRTLAAEGYEMHHCAGQYAGLCQQGMYRVYAVEEPDGSRSTLGIRIEDGKAIRDQHMGKFNGAVSAGAHRAARKLVAEYQQRLDVTKERP